MEDQILFQKWSKETDIFTRGVAFIKNYTLSSVKSSPEKLNSEKDQNVIFTVWNSENIDFYSIDKTL